MGWSRVYETAVYAPLAEQLVDAAGVAPGMRVLDVDAGRGLLTRRLAAVVGEAMVVAVVGSADEATALRGELAACRTDAEVVVADRAALPFGSMSFDVAVLLSRSGDQPTDAMSEMRRVARRALTLSWRPEGPEPEQALGRAWLVVNGSLPRALQRQPSGPPVDGGEVSVVRDVARFDSIRQLWNSLLEHLDVMPSDQAESTLRQLAAELAGCTAADGTLRVPVEALLALAVSSAG